ncbi:hypothetical protein Trydic_g22306 [Trypoxylus dichotomus]
MFALTTKRDDGLQASYNISLLRVKSREPEDSRIFQPLKKLYTQEVVKGLSCNWLQINHFVIQLDKSTSPDDEALLSAYVHFLCENDRH